MKIYANNRFYCFSPPVMVATFLIEIVLALFVLVRYRHTKIAKLIIGLLFWLGIFQLAEYFVCTDSSVAIIASRIGYIAITLLPAMGLHLISLLTTPLAKPIFRAIYIATGLICAYFLLVPGVFESNVCTGNYVIFQLSNVQVILYSLFYFGLTIASIIKGVKYLNNKHSVKNRESVGWLIIGYALFIFPTAVLVVFHPDTSNALPSVMCGFAILLALILTLKVAPLSLKKK